MEASILTRTHHGDLDGHESRLHSVGGCRGEQDTCHIANGVLLRKLWMYIFVSKFSFSSPFLPYSSVVLNMYVLRRGKVTKKKQHTGTEHNTRNSLVIINY